MPKKETCIIINVRREVHKQYLKELQVNFEANLSTHAGHVFQKFRKNCSEYKESVNKIHNQTCNFLAVEFPEVLKNFAESPWPE